MPCIGSGIAATTPPPIRGGFRRIIALRIITLRIIVLRRDIGIPGNIS
jgi:hypothetical protein